MTLNKDEAYEQAIQAYNVLTKKYKSPKDIPEEAWITGNDMEIGKWYLWVDGGHDSASYGEKFMEQHIVMVPEMFEGYGSRIQTIKDFDALWYLTGIDEGQGTYNLYKIKKGVSEWMPKEQLTITLDSFGLAESEVHMGSKKWIVGPLEYDSKSLFMNWQESPFEVKE
jgi:hypothetical protein